MLKNLFKDKQLVILFVLSFLITWPLFLPGYFSHHDDLQVMRIYEMRKCFSDLQIPCRWVPDMGFGNGFPLFNFYGVFPYYIGAFASFILGYVGAAKLLFFIPLVGGGISMFLLGRELFGKWAGLTAGVLYMFAPYKAVDVYVRGAITESFALMLVPLILYFLLKISQKQSLNYFLGLVISFAAFLATHNIMTMLFSPIFLVWVVYCFIINGKKNIGQLLLGLLLGFGLSAFFLLPAYFEQSLIQTDTLTRFDLDFRVHFVTVSQLFFSRFWGYGASVLGPWDGLSFQVGWPQWWLVLFAFFAWLLGLLKFKSNWKTLLLGSILFITFVVSVFMTHNKSAFIWEKIGILRFTQFPWRFLSLTIFSTSLLAGMSFLFLRKENYQKIFTIIIIIITIVLNWTYFRPGTFYSNVDDKQKLSGVNWQTQQRASILDYLPKGAYEPQEEAPKKPLIISGQAVVDNFINHSNKWSFDIKVEKLTRVELPIFDFPNWQVKVNGKNITHYNKNLLRRISFDLEPGFYHVEGYFNNTRIRFFSNLISFVSLIFLITFSYYEKNKKFFT